MPVTHRFSCTIPAGGNPGNVSSANWNDGHLRTLIPTPYTASGTIPVWSLTVGAQLVELVEAYNTITLQLPTAVTINGGFPGMNLRFVNRGTGVITITDSAAGGSFTYQLTNQGQTVHIYIGADGTWQVCGASA